MYQQRRPFLSLGLLLWVLAATSTTATTHQHHLRLKGENPSVSSGSGNTPRRFLKKNKDDEFEFDIEALMAKWDQEVEDKRNNEANEDKNEEINTNNADDEEEVEESKRSPENESQVDDLNTIDQETIAETEIEVDNNPNPTVEEDTVEEDTNDAQEIEPEPPSETNDTAEKFVPDSVVEEVEITNPDEADSVVEEVEITNPDEADSAAEELEITAPDKADDTEVLTNEDKKTKDDEDKKAKDESNTVDAEEDKKAKDESNTVDAEEEKKAKDENDKETQNAADEMKNIFSNEEETLKDQEDMCKSLKQGSPTITTNSIGVKYEYELETAVDAIKIAEGINKAVETFLVESYIQPICNEINSENDQNRLLQEFKAYVRGIGSGGSNLMSLPCSDAPKSSGVDCYRIESTNLIYMADNDEIVENEIRSTVLRDIYRSFANNTIASLAKENNVPFTDVRFIQGSSGAVSLRAPQMNQSSGDGGINGAGVAFLVLFILVLLAVVGLFVLRKYKPKTFDGISDSARSGASKAASAIAAGASKSKKGLTHAVSAVKEKYDKNKKNRSYANGMDDDDGLTNKIVIANQTMESGDSRDEEAGTEMILEDLDNTFLNSTFFDRDAFANNTFQEYSREKPPKNEKPKKQGKNAHKVTPSPTVKKGTKRYSPDSLPVQTEISAPVFDEPLADDMSSEEDESIFGDIKVVVDDTSCSAMDYSELSARQCSRSYVTPDTVEL